VRSLLTCRAQFCRESYSVPSRIVNGSEREAGASIDSSCHSKSSNSRPYSEKVGQAEDNISYNLSGSYKKQLRQDSSVANPCGEIHKQTAQSLCTNEQ